MSIPESYWSRFAYPDVASIGAAHQAETQNHKGKTLN